MSAGQVIIECVDLISKVLALGVVVGCIYLFGRWVWEMLQY